MPAYNNYFPMGSMGYQPMNYPQLQSQQSNPFNNNANGIIWVQGEAGAKAYPIAPNTSLLLMDSESECFYIKTTDMSGMPLPLRTYHYEEVITPKVEVSNQSFDMNAYVSKEDFERLEQRIDNLSSKLNKKEKNNE